MSFNDFVHKHLLQNKATSNVKFYQILCSIGLNNFAIHLRDGLFSSDTGILNLHPTKGTHWVCYINEIYFDTYGCAPPQKPPKFLIKRHIHCLHSEYKIQRPTNNRDSVCTSYCLYINY